jgi:hypothetical protein
MKACWEEMDIFADIYWKQVKKWKNCYSTWWSVFGPSFQFTKWQHNRLKRTPYIKIYYPKKRKVKKCLSISKELLIDRLKDEF